MKLKPVKKVLLLFDTTYGKATEKAPLLPAASPGKRGACSWYRTAGISHPQGYIAATRLRAAICG
jgi:hypothetical protein